MPRGECQRHAGGVVGREVVAEDPAQGDAEPFREDAGLDGSDIQARLVL